MKVLRILFCLILCASLSVMSDSSAQTTAKKTPAKTSTGTTQKKPAAKPKSTTTPAKKPTAAPKKPAASPQKKSASSTTQKKPKSSSTSQPAKKMSRADYEKQQKELIKQIAATERMISDNDKSVLSQSRDIKLREDEISKRKALLNSMQEEIESIHQEEDSLRRVIGRLKSEYQGKQEKYTGAVKHLFKWRSGYDEWLFVLSASDFTESMRRVRYLRQYSQWRKQEAHLLAKERMACEAVQQKLSLVRQDREAVMANLQKERDVLARKQQQQETALKKLKTKQRELKAALARDQKKQKEIQNMITKLIAEERKKAEAAQGKGGKTSGKTSGNAVYSPAEVQQLTGSFRQNKGKMPYPVDSNYSILTHYTKDGNYSITLSTSPGAHTCAIFEGVVQRVVKSSEDYTVIISHGEYMSVYSNLSSCHVTEGQKVKMRQSIGRIKQDIDGHCAELMFWIFGKSEAENPEAWLLR